MAAVLVPLLVTGPVEPTDARVVVAATAPLG